MPRFVDREEELRKLENYYEQCLRGYNCGVLIYGWRRVGKSRLVLEFVAQHSGIVLNCSWVSDPFVFYEYVLGELRKAKPAPGLYEEHRPPSDPILALRGAFEILSEVSKSSPKKLVVALDEFHVMVEKMAVRIARETRRRKDVVESDILWLMREFIERGDAFWILTTSMGWEKLRELYFDERRAERPLSGVLVKMRIDPLGREASIELCKEINPEIPDDVAEEVFRISGGVPRIIEMLAPNYQEGKSLIMLATEMTASGQFDEFFENIVKFVAEVAKRDYSLMVQVMKALSEERMTAEEVADMLGMDRVSAYNVLEELRKMEIVKKEKRGKRAFYRLRYPLLKQWLLLRVGPSRPITAILASELGIMAESYFREMLLEYVKKGEPLKLYDDEKGTFLAGTARELNVKLRKVLPRDELNRLLAGLRNADSAAVDEDDAVWLFEIKATLSPLKAEDVLKLAQISEKVGARGVLVQLGTGGVSPTAIAEAVRKGVVIITREGVRLLAKKIGFPSF